MGGIEQGHNPLGVGVVGDVVAQKQILVRPAGLGIVQAGLKSPVISVHIGQHSGSEIAHIHTSLGKISKLRRKQRRPGKETGKPPPGQRKGLAKGRHPPLLKGAGFFISLPPAARPVSVPVDEQIRTHRHGYRQV